MHLRNCVVAIALTCAVLSPMDGWGAEPASGNVAVTPAVSRTLLLSPIDAAKLAITIGDYRAAKAILTRVLRKEPSSTEALFLMAEINSRQHKYAEAIPYYRKILVDHPNVVRVRLDLARALFETDEDDAAEYNFHLALAAGDLPDTVIDNVERYLAIIRSRQHVVYDVHLGLAPDTNINSATAANHVTIFGLPFALTNASQAHSGVGINGSLDGEYRYDLQPDLRLRTGAVLSRIEYPSNPMFDDMQARAYIGPEKFFKDGSNISVLGVVAERWFGNHPYNTGVGGRLEGQYWLTRQFLYSGYFEGLSTSYRQQPALKGYYLDQGNFLDYYLTPSSFVRGTVGGGYQSAQSDIFENWYYRLGLAYQQEFVYGLTANVAPQVIWWRYFGFNPLFGVHRTDRQYSVKLSLYKRDFTIFGFAPVVSYTYTRNNSNEELFRFDRNQFELGFTRQF